MSNGQVQRDGLLAAKRVYEALRHLESLKKSGARVYGLDEDIASVKALVVRVEDFVKQGDQCLASGDARRACAAYEQAVAIAKDHPDAHEGLQQARQQYDSAKAQLIQAQVLANQGDVAGALDAATLSLRYDRTSKTANDLRAQLVQTKAASSARSRKRVALIMAGSGAAVITVAITVVLFVVVTSSRAAEARRDQALAQVDQLVVDSDRQVAAEAFSDAKTSLDQALELAQRQDPIPHDRISSVRARLAAPGLEQGLVGRVSYGGQWMAITERDAIVARREQLTGDLDALLTVLDDPVHRAELLRHIADAHRIRPMINGGRLDQATTALSDLMLRVDASLSRSGLEKYKNRWYTPTVALEHRMADQGLVRYGDKWVTPEVKEEAEMTAKGFVKHEGQWITPGERETAVMTARGLVRHEGQWMTPEDKFAAEQHAKGLEMFEGEWRDADEVRRLREQRLAALARSAYAMSTEFVKDQLKAPASAKFPDFLDSKVSVRLDEKTGHFIVVAYVDSQNSFGALLRNSYVCELWPTDDEAENWRAKTPVLIAQ